MRPIQFGMAMWQGDHKQIPEKQTTLNKGWHTTEIAYVVFPKKTYVSLNTQTKHRGASCLWPIMTIKQHDVSSVPDTRKPDSTKPPSQFKLLLGNISSSVKARAISAWQYLSDQPDESIRRTADDDKQVPVLLSGSKSLLRGGPLLSSIVVWWEKRKINNYMNLRDLQIPHQQKKVDDLERTRVSSLSDREPWLIDTGRSNAMYDCWIPYYAYKPNWSQISYDLFHPMELLSSPNAKIEKAKGKLQKLQAKVIKFERNFVTHLNLIGVGSDAPPSTPANSPTATKQTV